MPASVRFVFDPDFDDNLLHWRGSLNPVGDVFRRVSDKMARKARQVAAQEADRANATTNSLASARYRVSVRGTYKEARATAISLRKYSKLVYAAEIHGSDQNIAIVAAGHAAGAQIEFGGVDNVIEVDGRNITYPALHILRRSM